MADTSWLWVDAGGGTTEMLDGADAFVGPGVSGRMFPSVVVSAARIPLQPGQRYQQVVHGVTDVKVPLEIYGPTQSALRASVRAWALRLDPTRGDGRLRITAPGSDQRELICRYVQGLDGAVEDETDLGNRLRAILHFTTEWPYWQDTSDIVAGPWVTGTAATFFPFFPLRLSASEIFADVVVTNTGDVEAWPVWTIFGPGSGLVLRSLTTGKLLSLTTTLLVGDTVTVDTRPYTSSTPNGKTITKGDGTRLYGNLVAGSSLWSLIPGPNSIRVEMTGATAASQAQLNYRRGFLAP